MRRGWLITGAMACGLTLSAMIWSPRESLIWNRTGSAPQGLYWLSDAPFTHGQWVVVSARSGQAQWAEEQGFVGRDWPLLKQIAGLAGDKICRCGDEISVDGTVIALAVKRDALGRNLPSWQGCLVLGEDEIFLLNQHPRSLDGRYFGVTQTSDLEGTARLLFEWRQP